MATMGSEIVPVNQLTGILSLVNQTPLGQGAFGVVYKTTVNGQACAVKILTDQTGVVTQGRAKQKFKSECKLMARIQHPNIVRCLAYGDTPCLYLVMECMDCNLREYLEKSPCSLCYYSQVNIIANIAQALDYLHQCGIIHRDLSSANILMQGSVAKISDLGMAKLFSDLNLRPLTKHPGALYYMPPEALLDRPIYNEKIDIFSLGVLIIQILTRKYPTQVSVHDNHITEVERRRSHISECEDDALRSIAVECLADVENRPSAKKVCDTLTTLQQSQKYAMDRFNYESTTQLLVNFSIPHLIELYKNQSQQLHQQQLQIQSLLFQITVLEQLKKDNVIKMENMSSYVNQLEAERNQVQALEQKIKQVASSLQFVAISTSEKMHRWSSAVVHEGAIYVLPGRKMEILQFCNNSWCEFKKCDVGHSTLASVDGHLVTIGGQLRDFELTGSISSVPSDDSWALPPMNTKRDSVTAIVSGNILVVAGGRCKPPSTRQRTSVFSMQPQAVDVVEVLDLSMAKKAWQYVSKLPFPLYNASATVCNDRLIILGAQTKLEKSVLMCKLTELIVSSQESSEVWSRASDLPVSGSTCVTFQGRLLAVCGTLDNHKPVSAVYYYDERFEHWIIIGKLKTPRSLCLAAVLSDRLYVIGGEKEERELLSSIEIGKFY